MVQPIQPIAVLAQACRFAGADSPAAFWQNLANGVASVMEVPAARWSVEQFYAPPPYQPGKSVTRWGAFLADIQRFDAAFFNIPAAEAQIMDPQERILLELAYETFASAGYDAERRKGLRIGVFLGIGQNGYNELVIPLLHSGQPTHPMLVAHNIRNLVAGQIAHTLNLNGPALVVDTACSSSLVALHLARQSLLTGECDLALVGGINLNITATPFVAFSSAGVLAPSPHTYIFDERANGFVLGEGGGMLLLRPLAQAAAANDPILGLIRGSAINNDGHTLGAMTPSPHGQEAVLHAAYTAAGVPPESISYLEAHATGTRVGDVVEARALTRCFSKPPLNGVRYLGAVKPNVGHLLSAAAMPGLHKVLLAFQHRQLPPTLHGEQVRPIFKFDQAGITINRTLVDWMPAAPDLPLRAGVSSFGFGGTNAHVILEEPPALARHPRSLAHYTFAHTPFWIENGEDRGEKTDDSGQQTEATVTVVEKVAQLPPVMPDIDRWLQRVIWEEAAIGDSTHRAPCKAWLVLAVATPAAQALAERLTHHLQGQGLIAAYHCCRTGDEVDLEGWSAAQEAEWGLIFVGPVDPVQPYHDQRELTAGLTKALFPFHRIAQRLTSRVAPQQPTGLWVVTAGAHSLENDIEAIAPDRAPLAGFAFAINDEVAEIHCQVIDLAPSTTVEIHLAQVTAELAIQPARAVVAWRQQQGRWRRLVRQLGPMRINTVAAMLPTLPKGVYLITGGATGIGAEVARSLAGLGMTLLLTGRTALTRDPQRAALVAKLRKTGATVEYINADITQADEVAVLFDYVCALYGPPVGVIHAAGIVRPQPLRSKNQADIEAVLAPKVIGAWRLAQELQRRSIKPACFVLFSSIASLLPGFAGGLSDYAAANAFLDALAAAQRQQGIACTVINWSIWAETGIGAQPAVLHRLAAQGLTGLTTAEGLSAFYRALAVDEGQVVVYKPGSAPTTAPLPSAPLRNEGTVGAATVSPPGLERVGGGAVRPISQENIEATLQALLATILKVAPAEVSKSASFMNLGIDSMDALDLVQKLESAGFHSLPATLFFEYQTITDLAHYLANHTPPAPSESVARPDALLTNDSPDTAQPLPRLHSPIQRAFAINHLLDPERPAVAFLRQTIQGTLHPDLLQQAVQQVAARHPLLRTRFTSTNTPALLTPTVYGANDLTILPIIEVAVDLASTTALTAWEERFVNHPFDLATGYPWRLALLADPEQPDQWHLLLAIHHIAGDAWSLSLVAHELWAFYTALYQGRAFELPIPPNPFHTPYTQQSDSAALSWWRQQLVQYAPAEAGSLPFDHTPGALHPDEWDKTRYAAHATRLTVAQSTALTQLAATHNLSLFHLTLALYLRTLQQWSAASHLIVNVADAQRPPHLPGVMAMVGSFADTLPLAVRLEADESVLALAERIRQRWLTIQQHKAVSSLDLTQLWAEVAPPSAPHQPAQLTPLGFSFARFEANPPVDCPVNITGIFGRTATPTMRLTLVGWEYAEELHFSWNYITPLFRQETIAALADHFAVQVIHLLATDHNGTKKTAQPPTPSSGKLDPVDSHDHMDLPGRLSDEPTTFVPVTVMVQAQCQRAPAAIAVWENGDALTYSELEDCSTQIATALHTLNADCAPVGLLAVPSAAAIQLLLGIAKAGAAWVPLDPAHPPARQADQLAQASAQLLIFPTELAATAEAIKGEMAGVIQLYSLDDLLRLRRGTIVHAPTQPEQIAYIIFTSGSTGRPKGVPITHGSLANYIRWAVDTFGYGPTDRVMQATSLCFDASIRQILAPLVTGGTVVPVARDILSDPQALRHFLRENRITIWSSVPALWARLLGALESNADADTPTSLPDLRWIQVGGEALSAQLIRHWVDLMGDRQRIANLYGPTETTINATCYLVPSRPAAAETQIPIGYPIRGAQLQVRDENGQPCPPGAIGELWIGGAGLSPGYLHDSARTAERFITLPTSERFYRSGDRVQQQTDGALCFLGRLDEQVKVRGYRIELGEIEAILSQHPAVRLAAVITRPVDGDEQILVAYLEYTGTPPTEEAMRHWLQTHLPDYMLPHQIYATPRLPQMPNGKIDRQQLISSMADTTPLPRSSNRSAPQTSTEQLLAQVWGSVLKLNDNNTFIAREDDFFALGGDSLRAIQLFVEMGKVRPILPRATYLYRYRTLAALAQAIDDYQPNPTTVTTTGIGEDESFGVSLAQAGFLLARTLHETQATTWCARFALAGPLQVEPFEQAVQILVERHAMLRAIFPAAGRERSTRTPQQRIIQPERPLPVHVVDLQVLTPAEQQSALDERWQQLRNRQFDPTQWPLIEMHLCRLTPTDHRWLVATDHLIGDGLSGWLLGQELFQIYDALVAGRPPALPPLRSSFRDYVALQQRQEQHADPAAEQYWRRVFAAPYQPPKRRRQDDPNASGWVQQSIDLPARTVATLEGKAAALGVTPYELLLTLFFRQLQQLTGQQDLIVGSALVGRDEPLPDIMRIFGAFATALPLRVQLVGASWETQTQAVAQAFQAARAHTLSPRRIAQLMHPQTPLVAALGAQFLFSYMDFTALEPLQSETLRVRWDASQTELQPPSQSADLVLTGRKVDGQVRLTFTAPAVALSAAQIQMVVEGFTQDIAVVTGVNRMLTGSKDFSLSPTPQRLKSLLPVDDGLSIATAAPTAAIHFSSSPLEANTPGDDATRLDSALIGYLPPFAQIQPLLQQIGWQLAANDVRRLLFPEQRAHWLEALATPLGRSGLIAIPRFADELATLPTEMLLQEIRQAIAYSATLGVRCVSLAGMLPSHTRYGYALLEADKSATQPALTTGHSTTVVAVVKTVQAALTATHQDLSTLTVGCLGVGSIGSGALQLLLTQVGQPAALLLCDLVGSGERLSALAAELRHKFDYQGQVRIIEVGDCLPAELYAVDLLIGASSRPTLLDVTRLAAGSIVIDDSFPACLDIDRAIERMTTAQDLLVVGGGLLHCGAVQRTLHLPMTNPVLSQAIAGQLQADAIASCQLEALLWAARPGLPLTHGVATVAHAHQYWQAAETMGITAAPLHLRDFRIGEPLLERVQALCAERRQY